MNIQDFIPTKKLIKILSLAFFITGFVAKGQSPTISTVAGNGTAGYSGDGGSATSATLNQPNAVAIDGTGNAYIADGSNNVIRKVDINGVITTVAGTGVAGYSGDGGLATSAQLNGPFAVKVYTGNLYIADAANNVIRKVNLTTGIITTIVGTGVAGYSGDGGPATAATLNYCSGVALDATGNIFISDDNNDYIRRVDASTGIITTIAGTGVCAYTGDGGPAISAGICFPVGVSTDASGNVYLADLANYVIRKINISTGIITTVAGNGTYGFSGDGGPATSAQLSFPFDVAFDAAGNMYIADWANYRIRQVNVSSGIISTYAGNGGAGYSGDGGNATLAQIGAPEGVAFDILGNLYIADQQNSVIREVFLPYPQTLPYTQNFGTTTFSTLPAGMAVWTVNNSPINSKPNAKASIPKGVAMISATSSVQSTGNVYGYATSGNGRLYVQTSNSTITGTEQPVLSVKTSGWKNINISYDIEMINANPRDIGFVLQYRAGGFGSWTDVTGGVYTHSSTDRTNGQIDHFSLTLPNTAEDFPVIQLRWAVWRGTQTGASSGAALDNISISGVTSQKNNYFESVQNGNWNTISTWESSKDSITWVPATTFPSYHAKSILVRDSVNIVASDSIDQVTVATSGILTYANITGNTIYINNGAGVDLEVLGKLYDAGPNNISWATNAKWELGSAGSIIRNRSTSSDLWRDHYQNIGSIPATSNWIVIKNSSDDPTLSSLSNMHYGNLTIANTTGSPWYTGVNSSFTGSTDFPTIKGDLQIGGSGGVHFLNSNSFTSPVLVKGALKIANGSVLRNQGTGFEVQQNIKINGTDSTIGSSYILLSGNHNQTLSGNNLKFYNLTINKSSTTASITLNNPARIRNSLTFVKGILTTDTTNLLTFNAGSSTSGVNDSSFVSGPVKKIGNTDFIFPLGKHSNAQTIEISAPSVVTDAFQAEYFDTDPTLIYGTNTDITFDYVSTCQYFKLLRKNGTSNIQPTLGYDLTSCVANMAPSPRVIGFDGTTWKDLGQSNLTYTGYGGTISTATTVTQYGPITLGNNDTGMDSIVFNITPPPDFNPEPPATSQQYYKNSGQVGYTDGSPADSIKFYTEFTYPKMFFFDTKLSYVFGRTTQVNDTTVADSLHRIDLSFIDGSPKAKASSFIPTTTVFNYLADSVSSNGNRGVVLRNIYKNIDLQVYSNANGAKYYFVVKPGGNPLGIGLFFKGAASSSVISGSLTVNSALDNITFNEPIAYQFDSSGTVTTMTWTASWTNISTNQYKFNVGMYDLNQPLVYEITMSGVTSSATNPYWSTCVSSTSNDAGRALAYDPNNDVVFMGGETNVPLGNNFPAGTATYGYSHAKNSGTDAFIIAFDNLRKILWGTYFNGNGPNGGFNGGNYVYDIEFSTCATCDSFPNAGRLYVVGETIGNNSGNTFPHVTKPSAYDQPQASVSINGMGYIARFYTGTGFTTPAQVTAHIGKPDWITNFGNYYGKITGVDEDPRTNAVYITGTQFGGPNPMSTSCVGVTNQFPICNSVPGSYYHFFNGGNFSNGVWSDAFISRFNSNCQLEWSTLFGGSGDDYLTDIAVDTAFSSVYVVGQSYSPPASLPLRRWYFHNFLDSINTGVATTSSDTADALIAKFSTDSLKLKWCTLFGGKYEDVARQVEVNSKGDVYIVGQTETFSSVSCSTTGSQKLPTCSSGTEYTQPYGGGQVDNFIVKFPSDNSIKWSTYLGGTGKEVFDPSATWRGSPAISIDNSNNNVYVCGSTTSASAPSYANFIVSNSTMFDYNQSTNSQSANNASNAYVLAFDTTEQLIWGTFFGGVGSKTISGSYGNINVGEFGVDIFATSNNSVFVTGLSYGYQTSLPYVYPPSSPTAYVKPHSLSTANSDAYITEFNATSGIGIQTFTMPKGKISEYLFYPNPTTGQLNIKGLFPENSVIQVANIMGQIVYSERYHKSMTETSLNLDNLTNGIYLVNILNGHSSVSQKIVIFK